MAQIVANGITIEVERHGARGGEPILLIRGLGSQIIHWPAELISGLVEAGYDVTTFDNRDAGLSQAFPNGPAYDIGDMAADAIGVLDALEIEAAHVFGISMGGMIAQEVVWAYPDRVKTATIVMSSTGSPDLPGRTPEEEALLIGGPGPDAKRAEVIENTLETDHVWAGSAFPFDVADRRDLIGQAYDRAWRPEGVARQYYAILTSAGRTDRLADVRRPTLVIHGDDDALLSVEHGADIAKHIPGAVFRVIEGMGHDLDGGACDPVLANFHAFQAEHAVKG